MRSPEVFEAPSEEMALEALHQGRMTDGLPVIIPTPERVRRMLQACPLDADAILGIIEPANAAATVEKVAINAVMAGCLPDYFPLVVAAVEAVSDPAFNLGAVQATTHNSAPLLIVNGPARFDHGPVHSGTGALGPGFRANASIGRALRLVLLNIGGGHPGIGDMAQLGHPGKFSYCLAEDEESNPWGPLHASLGLEANASAVTALAAEAPHSIRVRVLTERDAAQLLRVAGMSLGSIGSNSVQFSKGKVVVILNPEHAHALRHLTRAQVQEQIYDAGWVPTSLLREIHGDTISLTGERMYVVADPADILIVVAGGGGGYSAVIPTWGGGPMGCQAITRRVRAAEACLIHSQMNKS